MARLSRWQRLAVVVVGTWMLAVLTLSTYEYATSKDGTFIGLVFPLKSIMSRAGEANPDSDSVEKNKPPEGVEAKSGAIGQDREPAISTERVVHWRMLVGALTLPFAVLLGISLLSSVLSWVFRGFGKSSN
jgi:hypothetical protein